MKTFELGLRTGGLMESPEWSITDIRTVNAENLREAKTEWARITGNDKSPTWNAETQTLWGWQVVEIIS